MYFSARESIFGLYLQCKIWGIFHYCKAIFGYKKFFSRFFWYKCVFKMKLNNFLVGSFLIAIGLVIGYQLQSAITQILESFLNTNTLRSFNLCGHIPSNLIHTIRKGIDHKIV